MNYEGLNNIFYQIFNHTIILEKYRLRHYILFFFLLFLYIISLFIINEKYTYDVHKLYI